MILSPDCEAGKHHACRGDAWDMEKDAAADCECAHHDGRDMTLRYEWNQPVCEDDWQRREPTRVPYRMVTRPTERCAFCGQITHSGIYVRVDPATVPYPSLKGAD